jgi:hypothetical protein
VYREFVREAGRMKKRYPRSVKNRSHGWSNLRQTFFVVVAIGSTLGLGALATDQYVVLSQTATAAAVAAANGDDIYTGSILYMPDSSDTCHQWLFNNLDGRFTDNGYVDCQRAAYRGLEAPKRWSVARAQVISTGFRDH